MIYLRYFNYASIIMYFDLDCLKRFRSFSFKTAHNQSPDLDISSASDKDNDDDSNPASSYSILIYSNDRHTLKPCSYMILPQAEKFAVQQIPASEVVGIVIFYLSAEPCRYKISQQRFFI